MIKTKFLAYPGAPEKLIESGKNKIENFFPNTEFDFFSNDFTVLVFLSGGSENEAVHQIEPNKFYLLIAFEENNSWASATEVKAWMDTRNIAGVMLDLYDANDRERAGGYFDVINKLEKLSGKKLGQVGEVSEWLVASTIDDKQLKAKLGIEIIKIPWAKVPDYMESKSEKVFEDKYASVSEFDIVSASKVNTALQSTIEINDLDAITVECFSLVKENGVTACLSLSHLNDLGIPAGCEGDITSIVGIMFVKALTAKIPWMANTIKVNENSVKFAHCTAPTNLLEEFEIDSHYETGRGTAVAGKFTKGQVTVFRLNNTLDKAFIAEGTITSTAKSEDACRTQVEINLPSHSNRLLKNKPLGNHHLIIPGSWSVILNIACQVCGIKILDS
jgi:L-fucose isomerase-like protein